MVLQKSLGGYLSLFNLTSDCVCGKKVRVTVFAAGLSAGGGAFFGENSVKLEDNRQCPDPTVFDGFYGQAGVRAALGPFGYGIGKLQLGDAKSDLGSDFSNKLANKWGLGVSAHAILGRSNAATWNIEDCCA